MIHLPAHGHPGSLCSIDVEPAPGLHPAPHPHPHLRSRPLPADAGDDLCPDCRRAHAALVAAMDRVAARASLSAPISPAREAR
jgi:hypothetical protein